MRVKQTMVQWFGFTLVMALLLAGCSTVPVQTGDQLIEPLFPAQRILIEDADSLHGSISDPFEGFNRGMYRFNAGLDNYVLLPLVRVYEAVLPQFARTGLHNFFNNIRDVTTLINSVLQLKPEKAVHTTGRLVINSTFGLLGFLDLATAMEVPRHQEDFGQTLGHWGVGNGPYLMLPIFGPSNIRDGIGLGVDTYVKNELRKEALDTEDWHEYTWDFLNGIDTRANVAFRYYETGTPFEYEWVRLLYTTKRQIEIED